MARLNSAEHDEIANTDQQKGTCSDVAKAAKGSAPLWWFTRSIMGSKDRT